jgi:hypothetical protein
MDAAPAMGVSTNDLRSASSSEQSDSQNLLAGGFPVSWSTLTGGLLSATVLGLLAVWTLKRRRRFARAGVYR